ncbi:MAG: phage terminase large subunit, partial [Candidatus Binatia bacterium]
PLWFHPACRLADYGHHNSCGYRAIETFPMYEFVRNPDGRILDIEVKGDYEILEPAHREIKWLLTRRGETGDAYFRREYQNDPSGMEGIFFHDEWLGRWLWDHEWHSSYEDSETMWVKKPPMDQLRVFAAVDPAISKGGKADYFAVVILGMDSIGRVFLLDTFTDRLSFPDQVNKLVEIDTQWDPVEIYVESNVYQDALQQQAQLTGPIPLVPIKTHANKRVRAVGIQPYLEQHRVFVRDQQEEFWVQWKQFPSGRHDDVIDAFIMAIESLMTRATGSLEWSMLGVGGKELHSTYRLS